MIFLIYLMGIVDHIKCGAAIIGALSAVAAAISMAMQYGAKADDDQAVSDAAKNIKRIAFTLALMGLPIAALLPSSQTLVAMTVIPQVVQNQHVQNAADKALSTLEKSVGLSEKAVDVMSKKLDDWMDDIESKKTK